MEKVSTSIIVNWAVGGVCKVFICLLGNFGTELLIAALMQSQTTPCMSLSQAASTTQRRTLGLYLQTLLFKAPYSAVNVNIVLVHARLA